MKSINLFDDLTIKNYLAVLPYSLFLLAVFLLIAPVGENDGKITYYTFMSLNTILFPYTIFATGLLLEKLGNNKFSSFFLEGVEGIVDSHVFFMIIFFIFVIAPIWFFTVFIAPLSLLFIYFIRKNNKKKEFEREDRRER